MPQGSEVGRRREEMCALRDGTRLRTVLLSPPGDGPWPALLLRHPYNVENDEREGLIDVARLVAAGYLVALQDVRGRFGSEGVFDPCVQELDDGADAVAWLAGLPECDGTVGMWGSSYASDTQFSALLGGATALRAIAATVTPSMSALDGFRFRGGVPELGSSLAWTHYAIAPNWISRIGEPSARDDEERRWRATEDAISTGAAFRPGWPGAAEVEGAVAWGLGMLRAELDSDLHRIGKVVDRIDEIDVPVLLVGGWFDVFLGATLELYRRLHRRAQRGEGPAPHLIVGPWSHSNMSGVIGGVDFGAAAAASELWGDGSLTELHVRWFDAALRDAEPEGPAVHVFVMGANRWVALDEFPPAGGESVELFFEPGGGLTAAPPSAGERRLRSDPFDPVPTVGGAVLLFGSYDAGPFDQRAIEGRADVLSWRTEPLDSELTVLGGVQAVVHLATTGTDADVVVRLCDEYPDGRSVVIADGIQRGSAREVDDVTGAGPRRALAPGRDEEFVIDLWSTAHTFLPGHRVRVDLAPSSSPRWQVGTNVFDPEGSGAGAVPAEYRIGHGRPRPSRIILQTVSQKRPILVPLSTY
ncbi:CocE/NonD family hydrolase [Gryllotalpicola daejeonensis]|uniref:CocE/NonD family hydrolase n=1 Tax=Gryllotalpicola daejeonensis TaxID=993087 RepID=A0ABP7ZNX1_9MICO